MSKPGERDDTLPPDHRFTEKDRKVTFPSPSCFCTSGIYLEIITIKDVTNFPLILLSSPQAFEAAKQKDVKPKQVLFNTDLYIPFYDLFITSMNKKLHFCHFDH